MSDTTEINPTYSKDTLEQYAAAKEQNGRTQETLLIRDAINLVIAANSLSDTVNCSRAELHIKLMSAANKVSKQLRLAKDADQAFADGITLDLDKYIKTKVEKTLLPQTEETPLAVTGGKTTENPFSNEELTAPLTENPLDKL